MHENVSNRTRLQTRSTGYHWSPRSLTITSRQRHWYCFHVFYVPHSDTKNFCYAIYTSVLVTHAADRPCYGTRTPWMPQPQPGRRLASQVRRLTDEQLAPLSGDGLEHIFNPSATHMLSEHGASQNPRHALSQSPRYS
jgi:hypothetical protein